MNSYKTPKKGQKRAVSEERVERLAAELAKKRKQESEQEEREREAKTKRVPTPFEMLHDSERDILANIKLAKDFQELKEAMLDAMSRILLAARRAHIQAQDENINRISSGVETAIRKVSDLLVVKHGISLRDPLQLSLFLAVQLSQDQKHLEQALVTQIRHLLASVTLAGSLVQKLECKDPLSEQASAITAVLTTSRRLDPYEMAKWILSWSQGTVQLQDAAEYRLFISALSWEDRSYYATVTIQAAAKDAEGAEKQRIAQLDSIYADME